MHEQTNSIEFQMIIINEKEMKIFFFYIRKLYIYRCVVLKFGEEKNFGF